MDSLKKLIDKIHKFYGLVESHKHQIDSFISEAYKPNHSLINQSAILRAVTCENAIKNTPFDHLENFQEALTEKISSALEEEIIYLKEIRDKINTANKIILKEQKFIENLYIDLKSKNLIDYSKLNPCSPLLEHVIDWGYDIWRYYHCYYMQISQALSNINLNDEDSVTALSESFKENEDLGNKMETAQLKKISFGMFTSTQIRELSVVEIKTSLCFNALDHPLKDGLYDLNMGPSGTYTDACESCKQTVRNCPGHFGHIELPLTVVNPLFHKEVYTLLKVSCSYCFQLIVPPNLRNLLIYQLKLLDQGQIVEAEELEAKMSFVQNESVADEAMNYIVKEKIEECVGKLKIGQEPQPSSKTVESLRRQFVNSFLKQVVLPKNCPHCKKPFKRISSYQNKLTVPMTKVEIAEKFKDSSNMGKSKQENLFITPKESREMLQKIWMKGKDFLEEFLPVLKDYRLEYPTDLFYMDVILVTPPKARPVNYVKGQVIENDQTRAYKNIVNDCIIMKNLIKAIQTDGYDLLTQECRDYVENVRGSTPMEKFNEGWLQLQSDVDNLLDMEMNRYRTSKGSLGLKQIIEKKEGLLRMHMMGKRVNFAARSVITPDPNLQIQEIGIPEYFAKRLTYPVRVNFFNVEELRRMVRNGPDVYPGAALVENENGTFIRLLGGKENKSKREGIAKLLMKSVETGGPLIGERKKVYRHLLNGDILLLNRQPTLHRPSIMAHKARILKSEKTLRMHYSNCKSYNADFDGDEMNAHFPQSDLARSEAYNIVNVNNHYLVPKDGTPLGGLIQDHIVSGVRLTVRGQMFNKEDYHQLVYQALARKTSRIILLPPCIRKPQILWSGKQIISTILINIIPKNKELISFSGSSKIGCKSWQTRLSRPWKFGKEFKDPNEMSESRVIIKKGRLLSGVLDKQHFGATPYGLTHSLFELYGGDCSSQFLDSVGKLCTSYLQLNGFTLGVEDILVQAGADGERSKIVQRLRNSGGEAVIKALDINRVPEDLTERMEKEYFKDRLKFRGKLDQCYKKILDEYTNEINKVCVPYGLISKFPENNLQLMVTSGAKGSTVNTMQISCLLGQIELEGKRPPWMISGKSLPCFKAFETKPWAGGYVDNRFMTGINPQEFFFHCMAGREGLIDTAVKTSRSGYLQRCLIKHLEGVAVCYDGTVRDHDGSVIQFAYGEDGIEVQKSTFLKKKCLDFLYDNRESVMDKSVIKQLKESTDLKEIEEYKRKLNDWEGKEGRKISAFTKFSNEIRNDISTKYHKKFFKSTGRSKAFQKILKRWNALNEDDRKFYSCDRKPDPIISKYNRNSDYGVIPEKLEDLIQEYIREKFKDKREAKKVRNLIEAKYMMSLCQPGEPVGLLAAQSVGEPSTQMTLNTFHFAGRGEMNVTLGIPRLREILMTASKSIKTPYIDVPLKKKSEKKMAKNATKLRKTFQRVTLADVLEKVVVNEKLILTPVRLFTYTVKFHFLPKEFYKNEYLVKPKDILSYVEKPFLIALCKEIRKLGKKYGDIIYESKEEKEMSKGEDEDGVNADEKDSAGLVSKKSKITGEEHESSDEEEEMDDDDATKSKMRNRHQENQEYEEPEESEAELSDENREEEGEEKGNNVAEDEEVEAKLTEEELKNVENRRELVLKTFAMIKNYNFDVVNEEWCEITIGIPLTLSKIDFSTVLKEICEKSVLYEVPNVKRGFVYNTDSGTLNLKTEGVNFLEIFKFHKILDINKLYSNDIHKVIETYGIEAGVRVIVKELNDVFGVYGITVDPRHLLLIADYMTHQGYFSPFNRTGMSDSPSPLQQMSFESSTGFLKNSLIRCKEDMLESPSSRIMVGRFCKTGTGCFDLSYHLKAHSS